MDTSGSIKTSVYKWTASNGSKHEIYYQLEWSRESYSIADNTSTLSLRLRAVKNTSSYGVNEKKITITLDDEEVWYRGGTVSRSSSATVWSGTKTISHDSKGDRTFTLFFKLCVGGSDNPNKSATGTFTLDNIPRQANITSSPDFNDTSSPAVGYSNPAGTAVTTLQIGIGKTANTADVVGFRDIDKTGTSYTFSLSTAEIDALRNAVPGDATTRNVFFCVKTVLGGSTFYSNAEKTFTITESDTTRPTISEHNAAGVNLFKEQYLQNKSQTTVTTTAYGKYGATISSVITSLSGKTYSGASITSDLLSTPGDGIAITTTVTDSRGFKSSATKTIDVRAYSKPILKPYGGNSNVILYRADAAGSAKDDSYLLRLMVSVGYTAVTGNSPTLKYRYRQSNASGYGAYANLQLSGSNYNASLPVDFPAINSYVVEIAAFDTVGESSSLTFDVPTARRDFQLKRGGNGASFGKAAELADVLDSAWSIFARNGFYATMIPTGTDFNSITHVGEYVVGSDSNAMGMQNSPADKAGRLFVFSITGNYVDINGAWRYIVQAYVTHRAAVFVRPISTNGDGIVSYGTWRSI